MLLHVLHTIQILRMHNAIPPITNFYQPIYIDNDDYSSSHSYCIPTVPFFFLDYFDDILKIQWILLHSKSACPIFMKPNLTL